MHTINTNDCTEHALQIVLQYSTRFVYTCRKKQHETRTSHVIKAFYLLKHKQTKNTSACQLLFLNIKPPNPIQKETICRLRTGRPCYSEGQTYTADSAANRHFEVHSRYLFVYKTPVACL